MDLWKKCVEFHGHHCGGLRIGYAAAMYAMELLNIRFSDNEQVVCISENDACGVDAIQALLGCSIGKGISQTLLHKHIIEIYTLISAYLLHLGGKSLFGNGRICGHTGVRALCLGTHPKRKCHYNGSCQNTVGIFIHIFHPF